MGFLCSSLLIHIHLTFLAAVAWAQLTPQNLTANTFNRRAYHSSVVAQGWLYIDGGEVSFMYNGESQTVPSNTFFSLDLSINWTTESASFNFLDKPANCPSLNKGALWYDAWDGTVFGEFSGETSLLPEVFNQSWPLSIWRFTPDSNGSGEWTETIFSTDPMWTHFTRPSSGLTAFAPTGGVYLGGYSSFTTSPQTNDLPPGAEIPLPGMVTHSFQTGIFANQSAAAFGGIGAVQDGSMVYVPTFGATGLYVPLAGAVSGPIENSTSPSQLLQMSNVTLYDPDSQIWYWQEASGDIPPPRINSCATGAQAGIGGNATYDIFLYNGWTGTSGSDNDALDAVYVLSLPAFRWTRLDAPSMGARYMHTCHTIGNRQLLVVGGLDPSSISSLNDSSTDAFAQGLGVFDMTELKWTTQYIENAPMYEQAPQIRSIYATSRYPSSWNQPALEKVMQTINPNTTQQNNGTASPPDNGSRTTSPDDTIPGASGMSSTTIAFGTVAGVSFLGFAGTLAFLLLRRRRRRHGSVASEKTAASNDGIQHAWRPGQERAQTVEMDDSPILEIQSVSAAELHAKSKIVTELPA